MSGKEPVKWSLSISSGFINSRLQSNGHQNTSRYDAESDDAKYCKSTGIKPLKKIQLQNSMYPGDRKRIQY